VTATSKDLLGRLADLGEETIARLAEVPGMAPVAKVLTGMRDRLDDVQHTLSGLQGLERRVEELERQVAELRGGGQAGSHIEAPKPQVAEPPPPVTTPGDTEAGGGGFVPPVADPPAA
jgi:hypothetical protein